MRYIKLSDEERDNLKKLRKTTSNAVVKSRIQCLLLSDKGHSMTEVARLTGSNWLKIVRFFNAWEQAEPNEKMATLSIRKGRGSKMKLKKVSDVLPDLVSGDRKLNSILQILETEYHVKVCKLTLQKYLKTQPYYRHHTG